MRTGERIVSLTRKAVSAARHNKKKGSHPGGEEVLKRDEKEERFLR